MKCRDFMSVTGKYLKNELTQAEENEFVEHLVNCESCNNKYTELMTALGVLEKGIIDKSPTKKVKKPKKEVHKPEKKERVKPNDTNVGREEQELLQAKTQSKFLQDRAKEDPILNKINNRRLSPALKFFLGGLVVMGLVIGIMKLTDGLFKDDLNKAQDNINEKKVEEPKEEAVETAEKESNQDLLEEESLEEDGYTNTAEEVVEDDKSTEAEKITNKKEDNKNVDNKSVVSTSEQKKSEDKKKETTDRSKVETKVKSEEKSSKTTQVAQVKSDSKAKDTTKKETAKKEEVAKKDTKKTEVVQVKASTPKETKKEKPKDIENLVEVSYETSDSLPKKIRDLGASSLDGVKNHITEYHMNQAASNVFLFPKAESGESFQINVLGDSGCLAVSPISNQDNLYLEVKSLPKIGTAVVEIVYSKGKNITKRYYLSITLKPISL